MLWPMRIRAVSLLPIWGEERARPAEICHVMDVETADIAFSIVRVVPEAARMDVLEGGILGEAIPSASSGGRRPSCSMSSGIRPVAAGQRQRQIEAWRGVEERQAEWSLGVGAVIQSRARSEESVPLEKGVGQGRFSRVDSTLAVLVPVPEGEMPHRLEHKYMSAGVAKEPLGTGLWKGSGSRKVPRSLKGGSRAMFDQTTSRLRAATTMVHVPVVQSHQRMS